MTRPDASASTSLTRAKASLRNCRPIMRWCVSAPISPAARRRPHRIVLSTSELQAIAPCVVLGPGDIGEAHTPTEKVRVADLAAAVPVFIALAERSTAR